MLRVDVSAFMCINLDLSTRYNRMGTIQAMPAPEKACLGVELRSIPTITRPTTVAYAQYRLCWGGVAYCP
jgi:hypothetical protein